MNYARFTKPGILALTGMLMLAIHAPLVKALTSDRSKPATIEADEVEMDFRTGKRTYKGDVIVVQGTLRITGDKMVVEYDQDNSQIEKATSWGNPATFKQRPDGKDDDVYGEGETIILNEIENTLTLIEDASLTQAGNTAKGKTIVYDMATDKMTVKGMRRQETGGGETVTTDEETGRAKVIITPEEQSKARKDSGNQSAGEQSSDKKDEDTEKEKSAE